MKGPVLFIFNFLIINFSFLQAAEPLSEMVSKDGSIMILIPAGSFTMGSTNEPDEAPERMVSLSSFYIDTYEVTHEQYSSFVQATGRGAPMDWPDGEMPKK